MSEGMYTEGLEECLAHNRGPTHLAILIYSRGGEKNNTGYFKDYYLYVKIAAK